MVKTLEASIWSNDIQSTELESKVEEKDLVNSIKKLIEEGLFSFH
jgi:hypothetical protein